MRNSVATLFVFVVSIAVVTATEPKHTAPTQEQPKAQQLNEKQVDAIVEKVMASGVQGKTPDEIKEMIKNEIKAEQAKKRPEVYHHVHKSALDAENVEVEEHVASDAIQLGHKKGLYEMRHEINSLDNEEDELKQQKMLKPLDPETRELQEKYEKMLKQILKEKADEDKPKPTTMELITEVEKRIIEKQKRKPAKTSDRMLAYMEELLRNLNGGTLKGADRFDMKGFVSSVFGRYRAKHDAEKERKRRILALKEHLARDMNSFEHQPNFYDEFYEPRLNGYDSHFNPLPITSRRRHHDEEPMLMTSVLPHPQQLRLSEQDRNKYLAHEQHSDHTHMPLNMPLVAPEEEEDLLAYLNLDGPKKHDGLFTRMVKMVKGWF